MRVSSAVPCAQDTLSPAHYCTTHVDGDKVDLGVSVLAGLRGRHVDDLAGTALDDDVTVLAKSRALLSAKV